MRREVIFLQCCICGTLYNYDIQFRCHTSFRSCFSNVNSLAFQIVQKLLDAGANINVKDAEENVPIHMATECVHHWVNNWCFFCCCRCCCFCCFRCCCCYFCCYLMFILLLFDVHNHFFFGVLFLYIQYVIWHKFVWYKSDTMWMDSVFYLNCPWWHHEMWS